MAKKTKKQVELPSRLTKAVDALKGKHKKVLVSSGEAVLAEFKGEGPLPEISLQIPTSTAIKALYPELSDSEVEAAALSSQPFVFAALLVAAEDLDELKAMAEEAGVSFTQLPKGIKWTQDLLEAVSYLKEDADETVQSIVQKLWKKEKDINKKLEAALACPVPEITRIMLDDITEEVGSRLYQKDLIPKVFGIGEAEDYYARPSKMFFVKGVHKAVGPAWVVATNHVQVVDTLPGKQKYPTKKPGVDTPIVKLPEAPKSVEELIDLIADDVVFLKAKSGGVFALSGAFGELYYIEPNGAVTPIEWDEYLRFGISFVFNYINPKDKIKYIIVSPKTSKTLKAALSIEQVAGLLGFYAYDTCDKLMSLWPDEGFCKVLERLVQSTFKQESAVQPKETETANNANNQEAVAPTQAF